VEKITETKFAFVALIGRPNTGKSTIMNMVLGQELALVSNLPQTTRKRLKGFYTTADMQLVFVDTPGIHNGKHDFNSRMIEQSVGALREGSADIVCYCVDLARPFGEEEDAVGSIVRRAKLPTVIFFTKKDICDDPDAVVKSFFERYHVLKGVPYCILNAKDPASKKQFLSLIDPFIPRGPLMFPVDDLTDENTRHFAAEFIRKHIIYNTRDEVPHAVFVVIDAYRESESRHHVEATIHVETDGQKGIVIGPKGALIKKIQQRAGEDLAKLTGMPASIICHVKVSSNWRDNERFLKKQGYIQ
jgi:GTP-binding protein Era